MPPTAGRPPGWRRAAASAGGGIADDARRNACGTSSAYDVDQFARYDDDALGGTPFEEARDFFLGGGDLLDVRLGGLRRDADRAAQLAVDLQHEFDLVGHQGGLVDVRPGRVEQVAQRIGVAQVAPQV